MPEKMTEINTIDWRGAGWYSPREVQNLQGTRLYRVWRRVALHWQSENRALENARERGLPAPTLINRKELFNL